EAYLVLLDRGPAGAHCFPSRLSVLRRPQTVGVLRGVAERERIGGRDVLAILAEGARIDEELDVLVRRNPKVVPALRTDPAAAHHFLTIEDLAAVGAFQPDPVRHLPAGIAARALVLVRHLYSSSSRSTPAGSSSMRIMMSASSPLF